MGRLLLIVPLCIVMMAPSLEAQSVKTLQKELQRAIKKEEFDKLPDIIRRLGETGDEKAAKVLVAAIGILPEGWGVEEAINALIALGSENVESSFKKLVKKKRIDDTVGAVVVAVAEKFDDEASEEWLVACLEKGTDFVARSAVPAVVARKSKLAIPALIDLLERLGFQPSTASYRVRDALVALTGQDFESIEDWRKFWKANEASLDPKNLDQDGPTGVARKMPGTYKPPTFFDVEILSNRVVFVVDVSGSMQLWDKDASGGDGGDWKKRKRIVRLQKQLTEVVEKLPESAEFNIIAFSDWTKRFEKKPVRATRKVKKKALEFIRGLRPSGATFTDDALVEALAEAQVDTIVLLTDGVPSRMGQKSRDLMASIPERIKRLNFLSKVIIHTFGFIGEGELPPGTPSAPPNPDDENLTPEEFEEFLRKIAEQNGGKFSKVE